MNNVIWLPSSANRHFRGKGPLIARYRLIKNCSERTARRHLDENPTAFYHTLDMPAPKTLDHAKELYYLWQGLHSDSVPRNPTIRELRIFDALLGRYAPVADAVRVDAYSYLSIAIHQISRFWGDFEFCFREYHSTHIGIVPSLRQFLTHSDDLLDKAAPLLRAFFAPETILDPTSPEHTAFAKVIDDPRWPGETSEDGSCSSADYAHKHKVVRDWLIDTM
ncbi:MAG: hypothetical protein U1E83_05305 [Methylotetracoccus sp.]